MIQDHESQFFNLLPDMAPVQILLFLSFLLIHHVMKLRLFMLIL